MHYNLLTKITSSAFIFVFILVSVILLGHTGRDDSHITYFAADMIASGHGIVNYNGEPVEQSSSLLFSFFLAVFSYITDLSAADIGAYVSFVFFLCSAMVVVAWMPSNDKGRQWLVIGLAAPSTIYWSLSGMENSLYLLLSIGFCIALFHTITHRTDKPLPILFKLIPGCLAALLAITRPEAPFVIFSTIAFIFILQKDRWLVIQQGLFICIGLVCSLLFRVVILGLNIFPNPVMAKQSSLDILGRLTDGFLYLSKTAQSLPFSSVMAMLACIFCIVLVMLTATNTSKRTLLVVILSYIFSIVAFSVTSGGDWMEAGRFLSTAYALLFLLVMGILATRYQMILGVILVAVFLFDIVFLAQKGYGGIPLFKKYEYTVQHYSASALEFRNVIHARDVSFVDGFLAAIDKKQQIVIGSIQAGMVPYYLFREKGERLYFVDFMGLTTRHIHGCRDDIGYGYYAAYINMNRLEKCINLQFDYIYDLDNKWSKLAFLLEAGCKEVFKEEIVIQPVAWKKQYRRQQFLVDCSLRGVTGKVE